MNKSKKINKPSFFLFLFMILAFSGLYAQDHKTYEPLIPYKREEPPVIDGKLDDPVWKKAPREHGFMTYHPDYGKSMDDDTIVYYAYDPENRFGGYHTSDPLGGVMHTRTIVNPILGFKLNGKIGQKDTIASIYAIDDLSDEDSDGLDFYSGNRGNHCFSAHIYARGPC